MKDLTYQEANTEAQNLFASLDIGAIVSTPIADVKDNWPNLLFNITFSKGSKNFICQYRKGVGHVKWPVKFENIPPGTPADLIPVFNTLRQSPHAELKDKSSHARAAAVLARHQKVTAHPYEVFACVCDDAHTAHSMSFKDYCDNFGMNSGINHGAIVVLFASA